MQLITVFDFVYCITCTIKRSVSKSLIMYSDNNSTSEQEGLDLPSRGPSGLENSKDSHHDDSSAGMSSPLPNPPYEKGTVNEGLALVANPNASSIQHKVPSVDPTTMGRNTSSPPDTVQPPPIYGQYGAWSCTVRRISPKDKSEG